MPNVKKTHIKNIDISCRLSTDEAKRLHKLQEVLSKNCPVDLTVSDVIRHALNELHKKAVGK